MLAGPTEENRWGSGGRWGRCDRVRPIPPWAGLPLRSPGNREEDQGAGPLDATFVRRIGDRLNEAFPAR